MTTTPPPRPLGLRPDDRARRGSRRASGPLRRQPVLVLALLSTLLLAACSTDTDEPGQGEPGQGESPRPTPGLSAFYDQEIVWETCDDYSTTDVEEQVVDLADGAECGRMSVPLDYADPEGPTASVAVIRIPATGESLGSLVHNPGGPGGSGIAGGAAMSIGLADSRISQRFDLVGFDPRGVGVTRPAVDCWEEDGTTRGDAVFKSLGPTTTLSEADTQAVVDRCADGSGGRDALGHVGTMTTVQDLDVLRAVLGDEQLNFLGQSYGTRLGAVYAEQYPDRVRAMVLDGAFDPLQGTYERRLAAYAGFQSVFESMAASCSAEPECPLGQGPDAWIPRFHSILRPLITDPVPARADETGSETGGELGYEEALGGVMAGLYSPTAWPRIIEGLAEVEQGRGDTLLEVSNAFGGRDSAGRWSNFTEANFAINCMDEERLTPAESARLQAETYDLAPFMDPGTGTGQVTRDICENWPVEPTLSIPYAQDVEGLPDTLVVSITGDPTTPHAGAISLADSLGSSLLTVEGDGHTIVSLGASACVDEIAAAYLIDLETPRDGATCTL